ncbi:16S rRNA (cytidine(1402)-2'-O)-methyltransferase [Actinomyces howellii]|uniref:Ribosomal RNA small subunit methyltransferase I n=1 Tax=Actinomyces howellii TaxID=52771 RepID=A0A448HJD2_9ACTO|nr:16S rRNA (cytidine(1402)-2'-O)-methyltransferase [Actinomyces howellii]VEG29599.1 Ribosomal RNA small subunit methyltransferase I [Actinomyces howellii]
MNEPTAASGSSGAGDPRALPHGTIILAATPIGNVGDASVRLHQALEQADVVAAEDTRRLLNLAQRMGVHLGGRLMALHEHNERERSAELIDAARQGRTVVVVSDAGTPGISDPGYRLVRAAAEAAVPVTTLPGPSAVLAALSLSGLATDRFTFEGFVSRKAGERRRQLEALAHESRTMVFLESPRRVHATVTDMAEAFGAERPAVLCRELTKTHEEVLRSDLAGLAARTAHEVLGEIVIVVAGARPPAADPATAGAAALDLAAQGLRLKEAAARVAQEAGLRPNEVYRQALELRGR